MSKRPINPRAGTVAIMVMTVLVPDEEGVLALTGLDGVRPVRYELAGPPPDAVKAEVLIPGHRVHELTGLLDRLPNLKLIVSLGAGVDHLLDDPSLPRQVPIMRLVDPHMVAAMSEYVLTQVLRLHRQEGHRERAIGERPPDDPQREPWRGREQAQVRPSWKRRVVGDDAALSRHRLRLCAAAQQVLRNGLALMGVSAPERLEREAENTA